MESSPPIKVYLHTYICRCTTKHWQMITTKSFFRNKLSILWPRELIFSKCLFNKYSRKGTAQCENKMCKQNGSILLKVLYFERWDLGYDSYCCNFGILNIYTIMSPQFKEQISFILKQKVFDGAYLFQIPASTF